MKNNLFKKIIFSLFLFSIMLSPGLALAQDSTETSTKATLLNKLSTVGETSGYDQTITPPQIVGYIIGAFIDFLGLIFIILMVASGYGWMTAGGNEEKVKKAQKTLKEATIGLVVTISAWTLWNFVLEQLIKGM